MKSEIKKVLDKELSKYESNKTLSGKFKKFRAP